MHQSERYLAPLSPAARARTLAARRAALFPYLLLLPCLVVIALFALIPLGYGVWMSLTRWDLLSGVPPAFGTLENYTRLLGDEVFWRSFMRTVWWTLGTVAIEVVFGLAFALLLNRPGAVAERLSAVLLLPWVIPFVVVSYAWLFFLESPSGPLQRALVAAGHAPTTIFGGSLSSLLAIIGISGWKGVPFMVIALLATLKSIPHELYEAARVDGATPGQSFRWITLPLLRNTLVVASVILGIGAFYSFDLAWILTRGGPGDATMLVGIQIYQTFFTNAQPAYAAAISTAMLVVLLVLAALSLRLRRDL